MVNEAHFSVTGYVATQPKSGYTKDGIRTLYMRVGWTPRRQDKRTGDWTDQPTSFISVTCYRKVAENGAACLRRGDPIVLKGTLRVREFGDDKRVTVDVIADSIGHDLSRGVTIFKKNNEQLEQTALERERSMAGAARDPLPGDRSDGERGYRPETEGDYPAEPEHGGELEHGGEPESGGEPEDGGELESGGGIVPEPDDGEEFDDEEARRMLAREGAESAPVGAAAPVGAHA